MTSKLSRSAWDLSGTGETWREHAACRRDPDLWFADSTTKTAIARHVCLNHCPVQRQYLDWASTTRPVVGVTGGWAWTNDKHAPGGKPAHEQPHVDGCGSHCAPWRAWRRGDV